MKLVGVIPCLKETNYYVVRKYDDLTLSYHVIMYVCLHVCLSACLYVSLHVFVNM